MNHIHRVQGSGGVQWKETGVASPPPHTQLSHSVLGSLTSQILEEDLGKFEVVLLSVMESRARQNPEQPHPCI